MDTSGADSPTIAIYTSSEPSGKKILYVAGEVDLATSREFTNALYSFLSENPDELVVDLGRVEFMDSSGVHALLDVTRTLRGRGGSITLQNPSHIVYRLLEVSGLLGHFEIVR